MENEKNIESVLEAQDSSLKRNLFSTQVDLSKFTLATDVEKEQQLILRESTTFFKDGIKKLSKNFMAMASVFVLLCILILIFVVPSIVPYSYDEVIRVNGKRDKGVANLAPFTYSEMEQAFIDEGGEVFPHIMGTDEIGRDYFVRVVYGTRISLAVGFFASMVVLVIGLVYGSISGYFAGKLDMVMMRIVDIIYSLPDMLVIIVLSVVLDQTLKDSISGTVFAKFGTSMISIFIVYGLLYWVSMARLVRGQILSIKENEYVLAAKSIGSSSRRIIKKHILPNTMGVIVISTALQIPSAIFTESFLSFIGLGVQKPMPSLGSLASMARSGMQSYPYKLVFPALMICLIVLALNLLGDGLRDAFDPKLRK